MNWRIENILPGDGKVRLIRYRDGAPLVDADRRPLLESVDKAPKDAMPLGRLDGEPLYAVEHRGDGDSLALVSLFRAGSLSQEEFALFGRGKHLLEWRDKHNYCGRCGGRTEFLPAPIRMVCSSCGETTHPRLSPCIIVVVHDRDRVLLVQGRHRPIRNWYSCVAGFVEAGETLEDAVRREVKEETGVDLDQIEYFDSQPWPFPDQLMIGFLASYAGGEIRIGDEEEIADARWFDANHLPEYPPRVSIAGRLIHHCAESLKSDR